MKFNKWTVGLAAVGVVSLASAARADEKMSQLQTALSSTTISGYVDTSAMWSLGTQGAVSPPYTPGLAPSDGFNLNAVDIAIDHPEDSSPWASGYHVELMFGPDAIPGAFGTSGENVRQAYMTLRTPVGNGIDWKVGVFDTIIGYEGTSDPTNPNFTRSYGYQIEPTTHTGILGTYAISSAVSVSAGVADTYSGIDGRAAYESDKTYLGSIALTAPDSWGWVKGAVLTLGIVDSLDGHAAAVAGTAGSQLLVAPYTYTPATPGTAAVSPVTSYYAGVTLPTPWSALKAGAAFDYKDIHTGGSAWVAGLYTTYQATDKLSLNARAEYLDDNGAVYGATDNAAEEVTLTAQYNLWANVLSRVEVRWDHVNHGSPFGVGTTPPAAPGGDQSNAFLLALNLIYQF
jgi:hypothetical protein